MKFTLTIDMDGAAFEDWAAGAVEVCRILQDARDNISENPRGLTDRRFGSGAFRLLDSNGNTVGRYEVTP